MNPSSLLNNLLQSALAARKDLFGEDCTFVSFEADDENPKWETIGFQSSVKFGRIIYHRHDDEKVLERSNHLLLKTSPVEFGHDFSVMQLFNEVSFYTKILPFFKTMTNTRIDELFPEYYDSLLKYNANSSDEGAILFENLQATGYSLPKHKSPFSDYDHLSLAMRKLGQFHAHSYRLRDTSPDRFRAYTRCRVETDAFILKLLPSPFSSEIRGFEPLSTDPDYSSKIEYVRNMVENCDEIFRGTLTAADRDDRNNTYVLCHGDFNMNNMLFRYDEHGKPTDLKMVDLSNWRYGSPVIDLAYMLYLNADQTMRNENWDNLIDEYYAAVKNTFPSTSVPSKDSILKEFNTNVMCAYFGTAFFLPVLMAKVETPEQRLIDLVPEKYRNTSLAEILPMCGWTQSVRWAAQVPRRR